MLDLNAVKQAVLGVLDSFFAPVPEPEQRSITPDILWRRVRELLYATTGAKENDIWLYEWVIEDERLHVLFNNRGGMYRAEIIVDGDSADTLRVGVPSEVAGTNYAVRTFIGRDAETGRKRWLRIVSTALLLRGSRPEVDTTELYDSLLQSVERTGKYHVACLFHKKGATRVGQADFLARDGYCLIDSGVFDDTPLAQALARSLEQYGDDWGTSIVYEPDEEGGYYIENIGGVQVQFWRKAKELVSADWLPEKEAAAWFTTGNHVRGGEIVFSEQHKAWLRSKGITEEDLADVSRQAEEVNNYAERPHVVARQRDDEEKEKPEDEQTEQEDEDMREVVDYEIGDEILDAIEERALSKLTALFNERMTKIEAALAEAAVAINAIGEDVTEMVEEREAKRREMAPPPAKHIPRFTYKTPVRQEDEEAAPRRRSARGREEYEASSIAQALESSAVRRVN